MLVLLTMLGSALWNAALIGAGWALGGSWHQVSDVVGPLTVPVLLTVTVLTAGYALVRVRRTRTSKRSAATARTYVSPAASAFSSTGTSLSRGTRIAPSPVM